MCTLRTWSHSRLKLCKGIAQFHYKVVYQPGWLSLLVFTIFLCLAQGTCVAICPPSLQSSAPTALFLSSATIPPCMGSCCLSHLNLACHKISYSSWKKNNSDPLSNAMVKDSLSFWKRISQFFFFSPLLWKNQIWFPWAHLFISAS